MGNNITKRNCSPLVKGKTIKNQSCLTNDIILKMKDEYNKRYQDKITASASKKIWKELRKKINHCNSEDCWLDHIFQEEMRKKMHEYVFSPKKPQSWNKNPNEWLSNYDIEKVIKQYERKYSNFKFIGTTFIDFDAIADGGQCVEPLLCDFDLNTYIGKQNKIGIIFNLDKHYQGGSHWVSMFIDLDDKFIFYFDSNGTAIPSQMKKLVNRIIKQGKEFSSPLVLKFYENHPFEHQYSNTECGMYSLFFLITMLTNKINGKTFRNYKDKIFLFKRKRISDKNMTQLRNIYFN